MALMAEIYPLQILIASLAGWMNRRQVEVLEYLIEENRVLKEQLKGRALRLDDESSARSVSAGCSSSTAGLPDRPLWLERLDPVGEVCS